MTRRPALLLIAVALLHPPGAGAQDPSCWAFRLPGVAFGARPFPSLLLADSGRAVLHDGADQASWGIRNDTLRVASALSGFQGWTLTLPAGGATSTAMLRRWEDNPHADPDPPVLLRAEPIACTTVAWPDDEPPLGTDARAAWLAAGPRWSPFDSPPSFADLAEVNAAFARLAADAAGARRAAKVAFLVGEDGAVLDLRLEQTTGRPDLDETALRIARLARMTPAVREGRPVASWVSLWFRFR